MDRALVQDSVIDVDNAFRRAGELALAKDAADTLLKHYPGYLWSVTVIDGILQVRNLNLSGRWGYVLKHVESYSATDLEHQLMVAGGEILERFRVARERMSVERLSSKVLALPTDFAGNLGFSR